MNAKTVKKPLPRYDTQYSYTWGIQQFGDNNLYPQTVEQILANSATGGGCLERYLQHIEGEGWKDLADSEVMVNQRGETLDDILHLVAQDVAKFKGYALHVQYDASQNICAIYHVPFKNCRLGEPDDFGRVSTIAVHPDWSGQATRSGKKINVNKKTISYIDVFDPDPVIIAKQQMRTENISDYKGQILYITGNGINKYDIPIYDKVITELSTDEGLSNIKLRNARNNFLPTGLLVARKSTVIDDDGEEEELETDEGFINDIAKIQGDVNTAKIIVVEISKDEDKPEFVPFNGNNYDKDFTVTDESVTQKIYAAFNQEAWYAIRVGKLGFSGSVIKDAYKVYNKQVSREQRMIERGFNRLLKYWYNTDLKDARLEIAPTYLDAEEAAGDNANSDTVITNPVGNE